MEFVWSIKHGEVVASNGIASEFRAWREYIANYGLNTAYRLPLWEGPGTAFWLHVMFLFFLLPVVWSWMFRRKAVDDSLEFRPGGPIGCP